MKKRNYNRKYRNPNTKKALKIKEKKIFRETFNKAL